MSSPWKLRNKIPFQPQTQRFVKNRPTSCLWQTVLNYCDNITETCASIDSIVLTIWHWTVSREFVSRPIYNEIFRFIRTDCSLQLLAFHSRKLFHKIPMWILEKLASSRIPLAFWQHSCQKITFIRMIYGYVRM